jgi:hypothetical protein
MRKKSWRRITARGGRAKAMKADVSKQADIRRLFDSAVTNPVRWQPSTRIILTVSLT